VVEVALPDNAVGRGGSSAASTPSEELYPAGMDVGRVREVRAQMLVVVESLRGVIDQIDTDAVGEPAFRLVVTGTDPILTADDGTVISPLNALAP